MSYVTVNQNYVLEIPIDVVKSIHAEPGHKFQVFKFNNRIEIVQVKDIENASGFLQGIDTEIIRDKENQ